MPLTDAAGTVGTCPSTGNGSDPHADRRLLIDSTLGTTSRVPGAA
jgi:hypothetical protein